MTHYSPEPPRRDLIVHHTFNNVEIDRVVDESPQRIDGKVVGDVTFDHPGTVGTAARMRENKSDVTISGLPSFLPLDQMHVSMWGRSERPVENTALNVFAQVTIDGTQYSLSHSTNEETDRWQYASLDYDGDDLVLRYAQKGDANPTVVDRVEDVGPVEDFEITFYSNGFGFVDDVRVYRTSLTPEQDEGIFEIGSEHQSTNAFFEAWDNPGIPFRGNNVRFAEAIGEEKDAVLRQLDRIKQSHHIKDAGGTQLDRIGEVANISRRDGESDAEYRSRIIGTLSAGRSSGTFSDLLDTTATVLGVKKERVELQYGWKAGADVATAYIYVRRADIDNVALSLQDLTDILKDAVLAGHDVEVIERGANPFTVIDDSMVNDPDRGLTSDSISTGGGLVSDA
jgi:hypothetical protein